MNIVLMVRGIGAANRRNRAWAVVVQIGRRRVILERLMMGDIVELFYAGHGRSVRPLASLTSVRIGDGEIESTLKVAPPYAFRIQQIADVFTGRHRYIVTRCTDVARRLWIADYCSLNGIPRLISRACPIGLARDKVDMTRG